MGAQRTLIGRRRLAELAALVTFSNAFGCGKRDQAAVLSALATDVVLGMARQLGAESSSLHAAVRALSDEPSAEQARRAQAAFKRATLAWKQAYAFRAGPFVSSSAFQRAVFWPARPPLIEGVLNAPEPIDEQRIEALGVDARGLYALEYLLFEPSSSGLLAAPGSEHGARARSYALELAANVRGYADRIQRLLGDGQGYAQEFSQGGKLSVDTLVAQALDTLSIVLGKFARIERAGAENVPLLMAVEGYFSGISLEIVLSLLAGTRMLYLGSDRGSLSELVANASKPIDEHVRAAFREAEQQLRALGMSLEAALQQRPRQFHVAAAAVSELRHVLEVEMQSALST